jgi:DNA-binding LacI/PurR family transcriptional regulator
MKFESLDFNSPKLLSMQVSDIIENKIINGEIQVGQKIPSQEELRKIFNVSIDTVFEALSGLTREGYLVRRRNYGTFVISSEPKTREVKKLNKKYGICVVFCPPGEKNFNENTFFDIFYFREVISIMDIAREQGIYLIKSTIKNNKIFYHNGNKKIAGLIVAGWVTSEYLDIVRNLNIPFVLIGDLMQEKATPKDIDIVTDNDFDKTYGITKYLIGLGHSKILYLCRSFKKYTWDKDAFKGYRQALKEAGIIPDKNLEIAIGSYDNSGGYKEIKKLFKESREFTGVVCVHYAWGFNVRKAILEKGLKVPEDISIAISGGSQDFTSISSSREEMGRLAFERLIERIKTPDYKPKKIIVPSKLTISGTTGKLPVTR